MSGSNDPKSYYYQRMYLESPSRKLIWEELTRYLQKYIKNDGTVLDIGAGYCHFINNVRARRRIALDINPEGKNHAAPGVEFLCCSCTDLQALDSGNVDAVFASNVLEHLGREEMSVCTAEIFRVLKPSGRLILIQPNFYFGYRSYFHDFTHRMIFTHVSMSDFLESKGFEIQLCFPKFLPMSMQSKYGGFQVDRLPFMNQLIRLYLLSPIKPFARQMLILCQKKA